MKQNSGEQFLHQKDSKLHTSEAVEHELERKKRAGEEVSQKPAEKISDWLKVIEKTHTGHREDPGVLERIKQYYHKEHVIKEEDIPESYYETQKRLAREQGHGDIEITKEMRDQLSEVILSDQKSTLDNWVEYFSSSDSDSYPMWAKYWAFTNMLKLSTFDKEKHSFGKRDKNTVAPFPDINREALAYVVDAIIKKANKENIPATENNPKLKQLLEGASFGKLYAYAIENITPTEENELLNTKGEWKKYDQGSDHMPLVQSLQGHGTGWCTAGESTARKQLEGGGFHVYYSYDKEGKSTIPRVAIRMQGNKIGEVRGIAKEQNLDSYINDIVDEKMEEFPDGELYQKKSANMKRLTEIGKRNSEEKELTKEDLRFLYEIDNKIEGFGYQKDPRIQEIIDQRDLKKDTSIFFDCEPNQIAHKQEEINKNTKVYIGPLFKGIFQTDIEHIGTSFPEGMIEKMKIEIGGKSKKELVKELEENEINIFNYARDMINNKDFTISKRQEHLDLVRLKLGSLGFPKNKHFIMNEIYKRIQELGLELCPAETGPNLRLQNSTFDLIFIGMEQIAGCGDGLGVFDLSGGVGGGLSLGDGWTPPSFRWHDDSEFVFRRSPSTTTKLSTGQAS